MSEPFAAVATCPRCHLVDVHQMRAPKPAPAADEIARWEREHETQNVYRWGDLPRLAPHDPNAPRDWGSLPARVIHNPPPPVDESVFEVIRICAACGHEWGMT